MSETGDMLAATATRLFESSLGEQTARAARRGEFCAEGWAAVEEAGLPLALLGEAEGGFGFNPAEALDLIRIGGYFAAPVPLGETMLSNLLLARAGLPLADGPATTVFLNDDNAACGVPWARHAATLVVIKGDRIFRVAASQADIRPDFSACGLPRDAVKIATTDRDGAELPAGMRIAEARAAMALVRALEMAGAMQRILELTVAYAGERVQFGRALAKFQAIQQQLAILATQAAAARASVDFAAEAFSDPDMVLAAATAKIRAGEAAGIGTGIAHQVHAAIGFTEEHRLHLYTRALWAWRDECGGEDYWQTILGDAALAAGGDGFWPFVTSIQPRAAEG